MKPLAITAKTVRGGVLACEFPAFQRTAIGGPQTGVD